MRRKRAREREARNASRTPAVHRPASVIPWLETLTVTQGEGAGNTLKLFPWERDWIASLEEAGGRRTRGLSIGRGAGKTTLTGSLGAAAVAGPWAVPRGLVLIVASTFKQARVAFAHSLAFMRPIIDADPDRWRVLDSEQAARIEDRTTGSALEAREAVPGSLHGPAPVLIIGDEPSQWAPTKGDRLFSALRTSLGKVPGSRALFIGTKPAEPDHWFAKLLGRPGGVTFAGDPEGDWQDEAEWHAANPSLANMPELLDVYREEAEDAEDDASLLPGFKALRLNLGGADEEIALLLDAADWQRAEVDLLPAAAGPCVWGVDLSGGDAMAAAACYWPSTGRLEALAAFPSLPKLDERSRLDGADYARMKHDGDLLILGQRVVPVPELIGAALFKWQRPARIVADYHHERELREALDAANFPPAVLIAASLGGMKDSPGRLRDFRRAVKGGKVYAQPRLLIRQSLANARTVSDSMGEERLTKGGVAGRKRRSRDDVAVAIVAAVSEASRMPAAVRKRRHYVA